MVVAEVEVVVVAVVVVFNDCMKKWIFFFGVKIRGFVAMIVEVVVARVVVARVGIFFFGGIMKFALALASVSRNWG